jgi:hypothetical protein
MLIAGGMELHNEIPDVYSCDKNMMSFEERCFLGCCAM